MLVAFHVRLPVTAIWMCWVWVGGAMKVNLSLLLVFEVPPGVRTVTFTLPAV